MKWVTLRSWVDLETGEVLTEQTVKEQYYITSNKKFTKHGHKIRTGYVYITYHCKRKPSNQLQLKFG